MLRRKDAIGPSRCTVRCTDALCSDGAVPLLNPPPLRLRFYIHGTGAFNYSHVLSALHTEMAGQPMDLAFPVGEAQYLSDIPIMGGLERHPLRTLDVNAAELHVIGALPFASYVLANVTGNVQADAADALAIAICHANTSANLQRIGGGATSFRNSRLQSKGRVP